MFRLIANIEKVINGFVVIDEEGNRKVFQQEDFEKCEQEALICALYNILESLGCFGSKHDKHRVKILCVCNEKENGHD